MTERITNLETQLSQKAQDSLQFMRKVYAKYSQDSAQATTFLGKYAPFSGQEIFSALKQEKATLHRDPTAMNTGQNEPWHFYAAQALSLLEIAVKQPKSENAVTPERFVEALQLILNHLKANKIGEVWSKVPLFGSGSAQARMDCQTLLDMGKQLVANYNLDTKPAPVVNF